MGNSLSVVEALSQLLADTYLLYTKTQNFHWNVTGNDFYALHKFFEEQYQSLANAVDVIAERIRALKALAPGSLAAYAKIASIQEADSSMISSQSMVSRLLADHEKIAENLSHYFGVAQQAHDEVTLDLFIQRKAQHDQYAWMLRSTLG